MTCGMYATYTVATKKRIRLKEEFNVLKYWHDGMKWDEFNEIKKVPLERPALVKTQDKIEQQKIAQEAGLKVPKTYVASREKVSLIGLLSSLPTYVAKASHMSWSDGLIIVKNGINMLTDKPITPEQVEEHVYKLLDTKPRQEESWSLHQVQRGFLIEEYIPNRMEVKIQTVFGRAIVGSWLKGESKGGIPPILGTYNRNGKRLAESYKEAPDWWPNAIAAAELLAQETDALRLDFLVRENGELLLNEIEFYPLIPWSKKIKRKLTRAVNKGYRTFQAQQEANQS